MIKSCVKILLLSTVMMSPWANAQNEKTEQDAYSQCVDQTIEELKLGNINNAVVEVCSNQTKMMYEKQIVMLLDRIKQKSEEYQEPERYTDILKSQRLWKAYVDQECTLAGRYIGSPMYGFCPMQEYANRVEQLKFYVD